MDKKGEKTKHRQQKEYSYSDKPRLVYSAMVDIKEIEKGGEYIIPSSKMNTRSIRYDW